MACQSGLGRDRPEKTGDCCSAIEVHREEVFAFSTRKTVHRHRSRCQPAKRPKILACSVPMTGLGNASGPIEITLHYENRGVVAETNSLTEIFGTPKNVVHQFFR